MSKRQEYIKATAPVGIWEKLFSTTFYNWVDESPHNVFEKGEFAVRAVEYSLPEEVAAHIEAVFNTVQAPPVIHKDFHRKEDASKELVHHDMVPNMERVKTSLRKAEAAAASNGVSSTVGANSVVTVAFLNEYYGIPSNVGDAALEQSVFETASEYMSPNDLATFQSTYSLHSQAADNIGGFTTNSCSLTSSGNNCDEGNLDIQYIMGISQYTTSYYWYVQATVTSNPYVSWVTSLADDASPPASNSMSWGSIEQVWYAACCLLLSSLPQQCHPSTGHLYGICMASVLMSLCVCLPVCACARTSLFLF